MANSKCSLLLNVTSNQQVQQEWWLTSHPMRKQYMETSTIVSSIIQQYCFDLLSVLVLGFADLCDDDDLA